jgi:hypothetical protein
MATRTDRYVAQFDEYHDDEPIHYPVDAREGLKMKRITYLLGIAVAVASMSFASPTPASGDTNYWVGYVVHVSTANIKVENKAMTQTLSFLLLPRFKQLFSDDGKTTYQMASLQPGMIVKVVYDQDLLGARHADKIYILDRRGHALKAMKS